MTTIYLDKFRGFTDTVIPFENVNFLVGENSSGKSSVLALLNLMSSPQFWFSQDFNLPDYEFGGFRDILSATAGKHDEFMFGATQHVPPPKTKRQRSRTYLVAFREKEALPTVSFYSRLYDQDLISIKLFDGKFRYHAQTLAESDIPADARGRFDLLRRERDITLDDYLPLPKEIPTAFGLFNVILMLEAISKKDKSHEYEMGFPFPLMMNQIAWLAPIRTRPKRTYDGYGREFSPEGEHTPYELRRQLRGAESKTGFRDALTLFGKESGLFSEVIVHELGDDASAPFEILLKLQSEIKLRINSVGYGISQALPLVVEMLTRPEQSWFAIQQPEVHLHPRAQAALGDLFFQMAEAQKHQYFIETHSDYTIDRFRLQFRKRPDHKTKAQILYFQRHNGGNQMHAIPIQPNGELSPNQPQDFRDFFVREQLELLGL